jgi:hypothetical protein
MRVIAVLRLICEGQCDSLQPSIYSKPTKRKTVILSGSNQIGPDKINHDYTKF